MSIRQMGACWYTDTLATNERLVALALADFADDHGRAYPSLRVIGEKTGYSRRQTQRVVSQLADLGYVEILIDATWNRTPLYQLHPEVLAPRRPVEQPPLPLHPDAIEAVISGGDNLTPHAPALMAGGDTDGTQGVTPASLGGDAGVTQTVMEPSVEPSVSLATAEPPPMEEVFDEADGSVSYPSLRARNLGWDALEEVFGYRPEGTEAALWGRVAARANAEPDPRAAILIRAQRLIGQWGVKSLTVPSLERHWGRFGAQIGGITDEDADRLKDEWEREARRQRMATSQPQLQEES